MNTSNCVTISGAFSFLQLPLDLLKVIFSYLPAPVVVRTLTTVASSFACIAQSKEYWLNLWASRLTVCFLKYIHLVTSPTFSSCRTGSCFLPPFPESYVVPLASVLKVRLPRIDSVKADSCIAVWGEVGNGNSCVVNIGLRVEPMRLLFIPNADVGILAYNFAKTYMMQGWDPGRCEFESEAKKYDEWLQLNGTNEWLRFQKALVFFETTNLLGVATTERPVIDGIDTVRISVKSSALPPPHHRDVTAVEREAALVEFIDGLVYAWERCHPMTSFCTAKRRISLPLIDRWTSAVFFMGAEATEETVSAAEMDDAVFFPVTHAFFSLPTFSAPVLVPSLLILSSPKLVFADGIETGRCLSYSFADMLVYLYLLHHITFSDIHEIVWDDERKCAICSRMVSPAGYAAEFRFFVASLFGGYSRFYIKMIFAEGSLPSTRIQEAFDRKANPNAGSLFLPGDAQPELVTLFYGGFGRVEVDISPTVLRDGFEKLRETLGLAPMFPMRLLWNAVMLATGIGGSILREQQVYFGMYYQTSFTRAFDKVFTPT